jgi:hypothetical protein
MMHCTLCGKATEQISYVDAKIGRETPTPGYLPFLIGGNIITATSHLGYSEKSWKLMETEGVIVLLVCEACKEDITSSESTNGKATVNG